VVIGPAVVGRDLVQDCTDIGAAGGDAFELRSQCGSAVIRSSTASHSSVHFCAGVSLPCGLWPPDGCASMGLASARPRRG
jgi:hypothetical protein